MLNFIHNSVAARAKAPVFQSSKFCSVRGFETSGGLKYESNFFWTDFFTFFFFRNTKGVLINHVDAFLDIFVPQFSHYRIEVALI